MWIWAVTNLETKQVIGLFTFRNALISQLRNLGLASKPIKIERWSANTMNQPHKIVDVTTEILREI